MNESLVVANHYNKNIKVYSALFRLGYFYPLYVRETIAQKLAIVANEMPKGIYLLAVSGYRDIETQKILWKNRFAYYKKQFPDKSDEEIYKLTRWLVCDPYKEVPPHTTGGAIDVFLCNSFGIELNISEPLKDYYEEPQLVSSKISKKSQELRLILNKLMLEQGFAPHPNEFWHFSYGDSAWANYYKKEIIYEPLNIEDVKTYGFVLKFALRCARKVKRTISNLFVI